MAAPERTAAPGWGWRASRRPNAMAAPKRTAAPSPRTASVSSALTGPLGLKPSSRTTAVRPAQSATAAAKAIRRGLTIAPPSALPHVAGDDDALDLVRALVDLRDLRVAHHALDGVLGDVAIAAEDLHRLDRHEHRRVGGEELGHRAVLAQLRVVAVGQRAGLVEQLARRGRPRLHLRELELDSLQLVDRLAEGDPLL